MKRLAVVALAVLALSVAAWFALRNQDGAEPDAGASPAAESQPALPPPAAATLEGSGRAAGEASTETPPEPEKPAPAVTGRAVLRVKVEGPDGAALAAHVKVRDAAGKERTADVAAGDEARFEVATGALRLEASAPGHLLEHDLGAELADGEEREWTISLERGAVVEGRVVAAKDGAPVAGAVVDVRGGGALGTWSSSGGRASYGRVRTDADGRFRTPGLPFDFIVTLFVDAAGFRRFEQAMRLQPVEGERPALDVRLEPGGRLRGRVLDPEGKPAAGARVRVTPESDTEGLDEVESRFLDTGQRTALTAVADAGGEFVIDGLAFGVAHAAVARATGHAPSRKATGIEVTEARPETRVELALARFATLVVRALGPTGEAVASGTATLRLHHDDGIPIGPDGRATFERLAAGEYEAFVRVPGFVPARAMVSLRDGERAEQVVRLERGHPLAGVVVDDLDRPVPNASIEVSASDGDGNGLGGASTDAEGRFRVDDLPAGSVTVNASAPKATAAALEGVPVPGRDLRIVARRDSKVVARFVVPTGVAPPPRLMVTDYDEDGTGGGGDSDWKEGRVEWDVPAGRRMLRASASGFAAWERLVEVPPGETLDLGDVPFDAGVEVAGRVTDANDRPVGGAVVEFDVAGGPKVQTDREGRFRLAGIPKRSVRLDVTASGFVAEAVTVDGAAPPTGLVVRLFRGGRLVATLKDAAGAPARGVRVHVHAPASPDRDAPGRWEWEDPDEKGVVRATLAEGRYRVDVLREQVVVTTVEIVLTEGKETAVEVVVPGP